MSLTGNLVIVITNFISSGGYPALLVLTFLDSTVLPVPNEAILPFAGFLIYSGRFDFLSILVLSCIGGVLGALTSYTIGYYGAEAFTLRFGKYVRLSMADLQKTHAFFAKYGERIILISRFIPVVRQFISIPAGAAKMSLRKFCLYTFIGSAFWNAAMLGIGYSLGANWSVVGEYSKYIDVLILVILIGLIVTWFLKKKKPATI